MLRSLLSKPTKSAGRQWMQKVTSKWIYFKQKLHQKANFAYKMSTFTTSLPVMTHVAQHPSQIVHTNSQEHPVTILVSEVSHVYYLRPRNLFKKPDIFKQVDLYLFMYIFMYYMLCYISSSFFIICLSIFVYLHALLYSLGRRL